MQALRDRIAANLTAFPRVAVETTGLRRAAVAIVLSPLDGQLTYLLTRRALTMRRGAGAAAIRETAEELGVIVGREAALGLLDDFVTLGGHCVTPVVLWSSAPLTLKPDPAEAHEAWHASVADLDHPESPGPEAHPDGGEPILRMFARGQWIN